MESRGTILATRPIPTWQLKLLRRFPRIPFVAAVEISCEGSTVNGKSRNLSVGGMLLDAACSFPPRTEVWVTFQLPTGRTVRAVARVVHWRPGKQVGIEFMHMGNTDWNEVSKSIEIKESRERRSIRIPERLFVELYWSQGNAMVHQSAQTILLSRHGGLVLSQAAPPPETFLVVWCPDRRMGASARVVSREECEGLLAVALEFVRDANFWGIDFEPQDWNRNRSVSFVPGNPVPPSSIQA